MLAAVVDVLIRPELQTMRSTERPNFNKFEVSNACQTGTDISPFYKVEKCFNEIHLCVSCGETVALKKYPQLKLGIKKVRGCNFLHPRVETVAFT
jgi:hypothetical protein